MYELDWLFSTSDENFVPIAPLEKQIGDVFSFYFICCMFLIIFHLLLLVVIPFSCCLSMPLTHNYLYIIVSIFSFFSSVLLSDVIPLPALFFLLASVVSPEMIEGKTSQKKLACFKSRINIKLWFIWLQQKIIWIILEEKWICPAQYRKTKQKREL